MYQNYWSIDFYLPLIYSLVFTVTTPVQTIEHSKYNKEYKKFRISIMDINSQQRMIIRTLFLLIPYLEQVTSAEKNRRDVIKLHSQKYIIFLTNDTQVAYINQLLSGIIAH
jgi:hypothetical protein